MEVGFTRYAQLGKFREIQKQLSAWERKVPGFLDWRKPASDRSSRAWLKLQRSYLESQYQCILMKISWSTASLDPSLMAKLQSMWEGGDPYADARVAARRVLAIVKDSVATTTASSSLLHSDAVRATTLLLQTLLRNNHQEHPEKKTEVTEACREGIALCRSLVPDALAKAEKTIEKLLDEYSPMCAKTLIDIGTSNERQKCFHRGATPCIPRCFPAGWMWPEVHLKSTTPTTRDHSHFPSIIHLWIIYSLVAAFKTYRFRNIHCIISLNSHLSGKTIRSQHF
jgi:hypothetical protein